MFTFAGEQEVKNTNSNNRLRGGIGQKLREMKEVMPMILGLLRALKTIPDFSLKSGHTQLVKRYVDICTELGERYKNDKGHQTWSLINSAVKLGNGVYNSLVSLALALADGVVYRWEEIEKTIAMADPNKIDSASSEKLSALKERFKTLLQDGKETTVADKLQLIVSLIEAMNSVSLFLNTHVLELGASYKEAESKLRFEKRHARNLEVSEYLLSAAKEIEELLAA